MPPQFQVTFIHRHNTDTRLTVQIYGPFPIAEKAKDVLKGVVKNPEDWYMDSYRTV